LSNPTEFGGFKVLGHHQDHPKAPKSEVKPKAAKESRSQSVGAMLLCWMDDQILENPETTLILMMSKDG